MRDVVKAGWPGSGRFPVGLADWPLGETKMVSNLKVEQVGGNIHVTWGGQGCAGGLLDLSIDEADNLHGLLGECVEDTVLAPAVVRILDTAKEPEDLSPDFPEETPGPFDLAEEDASKAIDF